MRREHASLIACVAVVALGCDEIPRPPVLVVDAVESGDGTLLLIGGSGSAVDAGAIDAGVPGDGAIAADGGVVADGGPVAPTEAYVARFQRDRQSVWESVVGTGRAETVVSAVELASGRVVAVGSAQGTADLDAWVVGIEPSGSRAWDVRLAGPGPQRLARAARLLSGDVVVAGAAATAAGEPAVLVARLSPDGVTSWQQLYAFPPDADPLPEEATRAVAVAAVLVRPDDGIVVVGTIDQGTRTLGLDLFALHISPIEGALLDQIGAGTPLDDALVHAVLLDAGRRVAGVSSVAIAPDPTDETLVRQRDLHVFDIGLVAGVAFSVRVQALLGDEVPARIVARREGGFAVLATTTSYGAGGVGDPDLWVVSLDPTGVLVTQNAIGTLDPERAIALFEEPDGTLFVVADTAGQPSFHRGMFASPFAGGSYQGCGRVAPTAATAVTEILTLRALDVAVEASTLSLEDHAASVTRPVALPPLACRM